MTTNTIPYKVQELFFNKIKCDTATVSGCNTISNDLINFYKEAHPHVQDIFKIGAELFSNDNGEIKISYQKDNNGNMGSYNHFTHNIEIIGYDYVGTIEEEDGFSFTNDEFIPALVHEISHKVMYSIFEYVGSPYLYDFNTCKADETTKSAFDKGFAKAIPALAVFTEQALHGKLLYMYDRDTESYCDFKYFAGIVGNNAYHKAEVDDEVVVRYYQTLAAGICKDTSEYFAPMSKWHKTQVIPKAIEKGLLNSKDESNLEDDKDFTLEDSTDSNLEDNTVNIDVSEHSQTVEEDDKDFILEDSTDSNLEDNTDLENNDQITIESVKSEIESLENSFERDNASEALEFLKDSKYWYLAPKFINDRSLTVLRKYGTEFADKILNMGVGEQLISYYYIMAYKYCGVDHANFALELGHQITKNDNAFFKELSKICYDGNFIYNGNKNDLPILGDIAHKYYVNIDVSEHSQTVEEDDKDFTLEDSTLEDNTDLENNNNQITIESVKSEIESLEDSLERNYAYEALEYLKDSKYLHLAPKFIEFGKVEVLKLYGAEFADKIINVDTYTIGTYRDTLERCGIDHAHLALELGNQMTREAKKGNYVAGELLKICYNGNFIYNGDINGLRTLGDIAYNYYVKQHTELLEDSTDSNLEDNTVNIDGSEHSQTVEEDYKDFTLEDSTDSNLEDNTDLENNDQITIESVKSEIESLEDDSESFYAYKALEYLKDSKYLHLAPKFTNLEMLGVLIGYGAEFADKILNIGISKQTDSYYYTVAYKHCGGADRANLALELGHQMAKEYIDSGSHDHVFEELYAICFYGDFVYNGNINDLPILGDIAHKYYVEQHTEL